MNFTLMLPCIVIDFFLNNQPDALIIQIYSVIKLYIFRASSLSIIRNFLLYIPVFDDRFHGVIKNLHETYQCRKYSRKLLMMSKMLPETFRVL